MKNHINKVLYLIVFLSLNAFSQEVKKEAIRVNLDKSIHFLAENQIKTTEEGKQYAGEWDAYMQMKSFFFYLGGKKKYKDSNCFTMAGIHNILAEMYLADTSQKSLLPLIVKVFPEVMSYAEFKPNGFEFNFWKKLPPTRRLKRGKQKVQQALVRRPTTFDLKTKFIHNAANVQNDADDTAMGNLAIFYHKKIYGKSSLDSIAKSDIFDQYLDRNRENNNWFNVIFHGNTNSGAYMTWLGQEETYSDWNFLKTVGQNLIFFLPNSVCYPHAYKAYIPWGTNDIDAVVNANVLTYLHKSNAVNNSIGRKSAVSYIEKLAKSEKWKRNTVYYPNRYHFHFATAKALAAGEMGLIPTAQLLLEDLKNTQLSDGSYKSMKKINKGDIVQSSIYALATLLYLKESGLNVPKTLVDKTLIYLETQKIEKQEGVHWKGGVFFSGGTIVRSMLYFTSDAYTTALMALAQQKYLALY